MIVIQKYTGFGWEDTWLQTSKDIATLSAIVSNAARALQPMAYRAIDRKTLSTTKLQKWRVPVVSESVIVPPISYATIEPKTKTKIIW